MSESVRLPFEAPISELENKMLELKEFSKEQNIDVSGEIKNMEEKITRMREEIYKNLSAWESSSRMISM